MKKQYIKPFIITFVILIIPFFYVLFFLKAFWDPYRNMKDIPVAIVNLDDGRIGKEIVDKIKDNNIMKIELVNSDEEANIGVKKRLYYSSITIPENFTNDLENLKQTEIIYRSNKKFNFIASQIYEKVAIEIKHTIKENVAANVVKNLNSGILDSGTKIKTLNEGLNKINDASSKILDGTKTLNSKYDEFNDGIKKLNGGLDKLNSSSSLYFDNASKAFDGLDKMADGVTKLGDKLKILKLNKDFKMLYDGAKKVKTDKIKDKLNNGGHKLQEGINTLNLGSNKLSTSSDKIKEALNKIVDGESKLNDGINTANKAVSNSVSSTDEKLKKLDNLDEFINNSVTLQIDNIDNVDNYGTVFAAYFMSISLWVGAIVIVVVMFYDKKERFGIFDKEYSDTHKQHLLYLGLVVIQSIILPILISKSFDFVNLNFSILLLATLVTDLAFFSMVYFFIVLLDDIGKFLSIMLLIIQISASAGTFPIETAPRLFVKIFPFVPMKYSVNIFKEAVAGYDSYFFMQNFKVLLLIFAVFTILTVITRVIKKKTCF